MAIMWLYIVKCGNILSRSWPTISLQYIALHSSDVAASLQLPACLKAKLQARGIVGLHSSFSAHQPVTAEVMVAIRRMFAAALPSRSKSWMNRTALKSSLDTGPVWLRNWCSEMLTDERGFYFLFLEGGCLRGRVGRVWVLTACGSFRTQNSQSVTPA